MGKTFNGIIISVKMNKTAVVEVRRQKPHPLYRKLMRVSKKFKVDTGSTTPQIGDVVTIRETRPISRDKHFRIVEERKK